ncbi:hypothetical protein ONZ45_g14849 [Pleurotus djamor]|nr:hypothetical protein ONZ45_g14849 [Pleurotus djamor]
MARRHRHASSNPTILSFNIRDDDIFGLDADEYFPDDTFVATVNRVSEDGRRVYQQLLTIPAPSPHKQDTHDQTLPTTVNPQQGHTRLSSLAVDSLWNDDVSDDGDCLPESGHDNGSAYSEMDMDSTQVGRSDVPSKKKAPRYVSSDEPLKEWLPFQREYLNELLQHESRRSSTCEICEVPFTRSEGVTCEECFDGRVLCRRCCIDTHVYHPLHRIKEWNGKCYLPSSLKAIGLRVQLGHRPGVPCSHPSSFPDFVVIHVNGLHVVHVNFCSCEQAPKHGLPHLQLLRRRWFPATTTQPQTCATLSMLQHFAMVTLQGKITVYDYYSAIEKLTDNIFTSSLPARYKEMTRIVREHRYLSSLKRGGRVHEDGGIDGTQNGDLGVVCPACPDPDVNLPPNWTQVPKEQKFIYTLFIALDACFRLKRRLVSSVKKDPGLGIGWSYFVEREPFRKYLLGVTDQKEISTCSGLAALDYANTKFSRGYAVTGVCLGVCARHEMIQRNGAVDLQVGERYANMDYCFGSLLRHYDPRLNLLVSYDIACQWGKHAVSRLASLPSLVRSKLAHNQIRFAIPKLHIHSHTKFCQQTYSLNYLPGVGRTDGEGIERPWANIGATATSTRVMGPGAREETLNQHWGHWNWQKLIGLGKHSSLSSSLTQANRDLSPAGQLLSKRLKNSYKEQSIQEESFAVFSAKQGTRIKKWEQMVRDFEADGLKPNPYSVGDQGIKENQVRLKFAQDEAKEISRGAKAVCDVTPSAFIQEGLDIEEQQRRLRFAAQGSKSTTTTQELDILDLRTKLSRRLARFRLWQAAYMPSVIPLLTARTVPEEEEIESVPLLLLPSCLDAEARSMCLGNVGAVEKEFRDAECQTALNEIRNTLLIKSRLLGYKNRNARHQTANTRTRTLINRNETKIKQQAAKYQNAWTKLTALAADGEVIRWQKLEQDDIRCMQDANTLTSQHARSERHVENGRPDATTVTGIDGDRSNKGKTSVGERLVPREGYRTISWIWMDAKQKGGDIQAGMDEVLRAEWAKAFARVRRWTEEIALLKEEMRRTLVSLRHGARHWESRAAASSNPGQVAYAHRQAHIRFSLADKFERGWLDESGADDDDEAGEGASDDNDDDAPED